MTVRGRVLPMDLCSRLARALQARPCALARAAHDCHHGSSRCAVATSSWYAAQHGRLGYNFVSTRSIPVASRC